MVKNPPANIGDIRDMGSSPGLERCPEGGHGNPLQYSCLENPKDRGAWQATVHRVEKSGTRLKRFNTYSVEVLMKLQYFGHLMQRISSLQQTLMLEKIEGRRRRG